VDYYDPLARRYCSFWMYVYDDIIRMIQQDWINNPIRLDGFGKVHPQELSARGYQLTNLMKKIHREMEFNGPIPIPNIQDWHIICDEQYLRAGQVLMWLVDPIGSLFSLEHLAKKDIRDIEFVMES
jgi:hypothetical protein